MSNSTISAFFILAGILLFWLAVKGRIRPVWDSFISGKVTE